MEMKKQIEEQFDIMVAFYDAFIRSEHNKDVHFITDSEKANEAIPVAKPMERRFGYAFFSKEFYRDMIFLYNGMQFKGDVTPLLIMQDEEKVYALLYSPSFRKLEPEEIVPKYIFAVEKLINEEHSKEGSKIVGVRFLCPWNEFVEEDDVK